MALLLLLAVKNLLLARLHIVRGSVLLCSLASVVVCHRRRVLSVGVCNTPRWACRQLHPRRRGDDVMLSSVQL